MYKKISLLLAVLFIPAASALTQEVTPVLNPGTTALLFSFNGLSNLGVSEFDGGVGIKWYSSNSWAIRAALSFAAANQNVPANPPPGGTGTDGSISAWHWGIGGAAEYHITKTRVSPFIGGGVGFSITRTESKNPITTGAQITVKNRRSGEIINDRGYRAGTTFSLYGLAGVEYFMTKEISLAGEYRLGVGFVSFPDEETTGGNATITVKTGDATTFGTSTGGALTLAIYF